VAIGEKLAPQSRQKYSIVKLLDIDNIDDYMTTKEMIGVF